VDLTTKSDILEARLKDEQSKRAELERNYQELRHTFTELDKKRANFENLGLFSDKLIQSVPMFTESVTEIAEKLTEHVAFLKKESTQRDSIRDILAELQKNTKNELQKQSQLIESVVASLQNTNSVPTHKEHQSRQEETTITTIPVEEETQPENVFAEALITDEENSDDKKE